MQDQDEIHLIVHLFAGAGGLAGLAAFEEKALSILTEFGAELVSAFNPVRDSTTADVPDEIHYLTFPNARAFESYKKDPRHKAMSEERAEAIVRTDVYVSDRLVRYLSDPVTKS